MLLNHHDPSNKALSPLPQGMGVLMVGRTEAAASAAVLAVQRALPASCHGCFLAFKVRVSCFHTTADSASTPAVFQLAPLDKLLTDHKLLFAHHLQITKPHQHSRAPR